MQGDRLQGVALRYRHPLLRLRRPRRPGRHPGGGSAPAADAALAQPTGPCARDPDLGRLEAVLFIAREPLGSRKLAQLASLADGTKARTLMRSLNRYYDQQRSAFRVEEIAGGLQLLSRPQFARWLRRIQPRPVEVRLSAPAQETLAVVAYRQPVLRAEVEAVRGVQCGEILRQLIERDLVRIAGRSDELGRPLLYGTTKRFLQVFGLRNLDELPRADLLRAERQSPETQSPETPTPLTPDTETDQPTPDVSESTEEKEVTTLIAAPSTEPELAAAPTAQLDDARADVDELDADEEFGDEEDHDDEEEEDEDEVEDDDEYEDDEDEDDDDDFEDGEWEEVEDEDDDEEEKKEEDSEDEEDDWEDEDWEDEDWEDEEDDEEEGEDEKEKEEEEGDY